MRVLQVALAVIVFFATPSFACSGPGSQGYAYEADVIVSGTLVNTDQVGVDRIVTKKVIKGTKTSNYLAEWDGAAYSDECAFLSPLRRSKGVYFLKMHKGKYFVIWTEKRWNRKWKTGS
jgi:hypothetical protein